MNDIISSMNLDKLFQLARPLVPIIGLFALYFFLKRRATGHEKKPVIGSIDVFGNTIQFKDNDVESIELLMEPSFRLESKPIRIDDISYCIKDKDGYPLSEKAVEISAKNERKEEMLQGCLRATTDSNGIAKFSGLTITSGGSFTLIAQCGGKNCSSETYNIPDYTIQVKDVRASIAKYEVLEADKALPLVTISVLGPKRKKLFGREVCISANNCDNQPIIPNGIRSVRTDINGNAYFRNLSFSEAGYYTLIASCEDVSESFAELKIIDTRVKRITFVQQPPRNCVVNNIMSAVNISVKNADDVGLVDRKVNMDILRKGGKVDDILQGTLTGFTDSNGYLEFKDLSINRTGIFILVVQCEGVVMRSREITVMPPGVGMDMDLSHYEFDTQNYWDTLEFKINMKYGGSSVSVNH